MVELTKALLKFHMEVGKIKKDGKNPFFKSSYATLSNILDIVQPILVTCGLNIIQMPMGDGELKTVLVHESGEHVEFAFNMNITKRDPQAMGSAITYARRYAIVALLCLNIEEDDDGNMGSMVSGAPQGATTGDNAKGKGNVSSDDRKWLNATNKDGKLTETGHKVSASIANGEVDWKRIERSYKVSKKDKDAVNAQVTSLKGDIDLHVDEASNPLPF